MNTCPQSPPSHIRRAPVFSAASWLAPILGALITWGLYAHAVAHRNPGEWLPGIGELVIGTIAIALCAFGCGLTALLRRERHRWVAVPPFVAGLGAILYFAGNLLGNSFR